MISTRISFSLSRLSNQYLVDMNHCNCQAISHGHETTISIVGLNGVVHESTFSEEKTADSLDALRNEALQKKMLGRMYGGTRNRFFD